jgi:hypothetical protein
MSRLSVFAFGVLLAVSGVPLVASDHIDGVLTTSLRAGDLTDLYAFPTPGRPGSLTVILNAFPLVPADGQFSEPVRYAILVRRAAIQEADGRLFVQTDDERTIDCAVTPQKVVGCGGSGLAPFRVDSGMRSDPFFLNTDFFSQAAEGKLDPPVDDNVMRGANVLAIVLEIDLSQLYDAPPPMVAVAAESMRNSSTLDRVGRPEFTNVGLAPRDEADLRDRYNLERTFHVPAAAQRVYRQKLATNVAAYDALDGRKDWKDGDLETLATLVADDFLLVDLDKPCPANSFLEIEKSILRHGAHQTCGGRRPEDDIVDTLYTLYIAGIDGAPVRDGVDHPALALSATFPYLAAPDLSLWSRFRVFVGRKRLGIPELD